MNMSGLADLAALSTLAASTPPQTSTVSSSNTQPLFDSRSTSAGGQGVSARKKARVQVEPYAPIERRSCNCKNSRCLKLYCECFTARVYCNGCACVGCHNTPEHERLVAKAIDDTQERNPAAFSVEEKTAKGCNCRKSSCQKKYCECFQQGVLCGDNCNCVDCKNHAGDPVAAAARPSAAAAAAAAAARAADDAVRRAKSEAQRTTGVAVATSSTPFPITATTTDAVAQEQEAVFMSAPQVAAHTVAREFASERTLLNIASNLLTRAQHAALNSEPGADGVPVPLANKALAEVADALHKSGETALASPSKAPARTTPNEASNSIARSKKRSASDRSSKRISTPAKGDNNTGTDVDSGNADTLARQEAAVLGGVVEILDRAVKASATLEASLEHSEL